VTQAPSLIGLFVTPLNRAGIEYMVTGGLAAVVYGHPRLTLDVDLVIRLTPRGALAFATLWPPNEFYCPPVEVITEESERVAFGHFNVIHTESAMRADVYFAGTDELSAWALENRAVRAIDSQDVYFAPIEYVIVNKLRYFKMGGSDRHLRDVARMMEISGSTVRHSVLDEWIARLNLGDEWVKARLFEGRDD
jgi:hypothetical protein